jgi:hypothetical protein
MMNPPPLNISYYEYNKKLSMVNDQCQVNNFYKTYPTYTTQNPPNFNRNY